MNYSLLLQLMLYLLLLYSSVSFHPLRTTHWITHTVNNAPSTYIFPLVLEFQRIKLMSHRTLPSSSQTTSASSTSSHPPPFISTSSSVTTPLLPSNITIKDLSLFDVFDVLKLTGAEFLPTCSTVKEKCDLLQNMITLFVPKLVSPLVWQHKIIGIYSAHRGSLVAFVDVSLQTVTGSQYLLCSLHSC